MGFVLIYHFPVYRTPLCVIASVENLHKRSDILTAEQKRSHRARKAQMKGVCPFVVVSLQWLVLEVDVSR